LKRALTLGALLLAGCATPQAREAPPMLAITIDDLPVMEPYPPGTTANQVSEQMIAAIRAAGVSGVTGFVNAKWLQDRPETGAALEAWRGAGVLLGNHGWAHRGLSGMSPAEFESEVVKNDDVLEKLGQGADWRWFRYPYLDEGESAEKRRTARQILAAHGYRVAAVTMGFSDWQWTQPYARCMAAGDKAAVSQLERMYLDAARENIAVGRDTAHKLYERDIPYVLLMHVSAMSARMMPRLLGLYRDEGFRFVSLAEAQGDAVYRSDTDLNLPPPLEPGELARRKGLKLRVPTDYSARLSAMCTETAGAKG
jgi:peptidoglycan/xylan/chitin deacetylase (PgdA/CDA1 family)